MIKEVSAMKVRQHLGELLNEIQYRHSKVIITKAGKPVAALVDIAMFERLRKLDEEFDSLRAEISRAFASKSENEVEVQVDEAVKAARKQPRRRS